MSVYADLVSSLLLLLLFVGAGSPLGLTFSAALRRAEAGAPDRVRENRSGRRPVRVRN